MLKDMMTVAAECVKHPQHQSVWSSQLGRYICPKSEGAETLKLIAESHSGQAPNNKVMPQINSYFKLIFITAAGGTFLFVLICISIALAVGKEPPPLTEKVILGMFDLAKIGFGAIVGLLGGFIARPKES